MELIGIKVSGYLFWVPNKECSVIRQGNSVNGDCLG